MSKVFTPEEVRLGRVPHAEDFRPLADKYRKWLPTRSWFAGAIEFGSVLRGTPSRRSDLDLLIAYREDSGELAREELKDFRTRQGGYVPVNRQLLSTREIQYGMHTLGRGFLAHLEWAAENGGLIGSNPLVGIKLKGRHDARQDLEHYIVRKIRRCRNCDDDSWTEARCRVLENIAMAPTHAARRWLSLNGHADSTLHNKADVVRLLGEHLPSAAEKLRTVLTADAAYAEELNACLARYNRDKYNQALQQLSNHVGDTLVFLEKLSVR